MGRMIVIIGKLDLWGGITEYQNLHSFYDVCKPIHRHGWKDYYRNILEIKLMDKVNVKLMNYENW